MKTMCTDSSDTNLYAEKRVFCPDLPWLEQNSLYFCHDVGYHRTVWENNPVPNQGVQSGRGHRSSSNFDTINEPHPTHMHIRPRGFKFMNKHVKRTVCKYTHINCGPKRRGALDIRLQIYVVVC